MGWFFKKTSKILLQRLEDRVSHCFKIVLNLWVDDQKIPIPLCCSVNAKYCFSRVAGLMLKLQVWQVLLCIEPFSVSQGRFMTSLLFQTITSCYLLYATSLDLNSWIITKVPKCSNANVINLLLYRRTNQLPSKNQPVRPWWRAEDSSTPFGTPQVRNSFSIFWPTLIPF